MFDNPRSDRIKRVAALSGRSTRKKTGLILVEGPQAVRELVRFAPAAIKDVYVTEGFVSSYADLTAELESATRWVHIASDQVMAKISTEAQGVVAVAEAGKLTEGSPPREGDFVVLLPETQDPGNLGTLIRTADAMGASAVYLGEGTCELWNPKVIRASAGSVFHLPIRKEDYFETARVLREGGVQLLGTALAGDSASLDALLLGALAEKGSALSGRHAWVFGNESRGLSLGEQEACDQLVFIPMRGDAESLNVAAAAAMCMFASSLTNSVSAAHPVSAAHGAGEAS